MGSGNLRVRTHDFRRGLARALVALLVALAMPGLALARAPATAPAAHPALWQVQRGRTTIYLFGTIHVLKPGTVWLIGPVRRAIDRADTLVTEVADPTGTATQSALLARASLPEGQTLRALLAPAQREAYEALLAREKIPAAALDRFKPWYAAVILSATPLLRQGFGPKDGAEAALNAAIAAGRDGHGRARAVAHDALETADYQLGLFDSLPQDAQLGFLASVVRDYAKIGPDIATIIAAWQRGDAAALARTMNAEMDDPRLVERLLLQRNRAWAQWIGQRLNRPGTVFVAVGAGHLAGAGSVQDQLAAAGIRAQRVQ